MHLRHSPPGHGIAVQLFQLNASWCLLSANVILHAHVKAWGACPTLLLMGGTDVVFRQISCRKGSKWPQAETMGVTVNCGLGIPLPSPRRPNIN